MVGQEQWAWLEETLTQSQADVHLIVSGLQIIPEHRYIGESWSRFARSREKLFNLLLSHGVKAPVLMSGDIHMAEMHEAYCHTMNRTGLLPEVTSSGMTHSWQTGPPQSRNGVVRVVMHNLMYWAQLFMPFWYRNSMASHPEAPTSGIYLGKNFGEIEIDWSQRQLVVRIHGEGDQSVVLEQQYGFDDLGATGKSRQEGGEPSWNCAPQGKHRPSAIRIGAGVLGTLLFGVAPVVVPLCIVVWLLLKWLWSFRQHRKIPVKARKQA